MLLRSRRRLLIKNLPVAQYSRIAFCIFLFVLVAQILLILGNQLPEPLLISMANAQTDVTTAAVGGDGGSSFSVSCPTGSILVGLTVGSGLVVDSIQGVCARISAEGHQVGDPIVLLGGKVGGSGGTKYSRICPDGQAIVGLRVGDGWYVTHLGVLCATVGPDGKRSGSPSLIGGDLLGTAPADVSEGQQGDVELLCPSNKISKGYFGKAARFVDNIGLVCGIVPLAAPLISVAVSPSDVFAGTTLTGRVRLNGTVPGGQNVALSVYGAPGAEVPASVTVPADSSSADFPVFLSADTMGCATIIASSQGGVRFAYLLISPQRPPHAGITFLTESSSSGIYFGPRTLNAKILFSGTRGTLSNGTIDVYTSNSVVIPSPGLIYFPKAARFVSVPLVLNNDGCAIISATWSGTTLRRAFRVVLIGG
jgi:hypothetical protein